MLYFFNSILCLSRSFSARNGQVYAYVYCFHFSLFSLFSIHFISFKNAIKCHSKEYFVRVLFSFVSIMELMLNVLNMLTICRIVMQK